MPVLDGGLVMTVGGDDPAGPAQRGPRPGLPRPRRAHRPADHARLAKREAIRLTQGEVRGRPRLVVLPRETRQARLGGQRLRRRHVRRRRPAQRRLLLPRRRERRPARGPPDDGRAGRAGRVQQAALAGLAAGLAPAEPDDAGEPPRPPRASRSTSPAPRRTSARSPPRACATTRAWRSSTPRRRATTPRTGKGGIYTFTADGSSSNSALPGRQYVEDSTQISDPDAIGAQKVSRIVYDYYASIGRNSWDGKGASMVSTVNFSDGEFCNAFFSSGLQQMVYGNPCEGPAAACSWSPST